MNINWNLLCERIYEKQCVLFIGNEFPIEITNENETIKSSFSKLLSDYLINEHNLKSESEFYLKDRKDFDLCQIASFCVPRKISSQELNFEITDFLERSLINITSESYRELLKLPFTLIIDTNYSDFFYKECNKPNTDSSLQKYSRKDLYNFNGKIAKTVFEQNEFFQNMSEPCIYNLFGSYEEPDSLAITEYDLIDLLTNVITKAPALPSNLMAKLKDKNTCFLFIGFGLKYKDWYFRILMRVLECRNKEKKSFALESLYSLGDYENCTVLFFKENYKMDLLQQDSKEFVKSLVDEYEKFETKRNQNKRGDSPVAFISYVREDEETIKKIKSRLEFNGITVSIDKTGIGTENWKPAITRLLNSSDAFILAQSKKLKEVVNNESSYICDEIEIAFDIVDRKNYKEKSDFLFPTYIDESHSVVRKYPKLCDLNSSDIILDENFNKKIDRLAKAINLAYERRNTRTI